MASRKISSTSLSSLELFTGAGGLALATHAEGFKHLGLFEWNKDACETLRANSLTGAMPGLQDWHSKVNEGDVSKVDFSKYAGVDLVAGGPPCQPFSLGGKHRGMEDHRDMIPQFIRSVREIRPRAFIMENVRGLVRQSFKDYLRYTILQLSFPDVGRKSREDWPTHLTRLEKQSKQKSSIGGSTYSIKWKVLNSADYGVPQVRERLFIVGFRADIDSGWEFPLATHSRDALIHSQWISGDYWRDALTSAHKPSPIEKKAAARVAKIKSPLTAKPWVTIRQAIADLPEPFDGTDAKGEIFNHRFQPGARPYPGHTGSPIDWPSKTLKAGGHGVPGGENMIAFGNGKYRYLTVREAARVQTFPDDWHFRGAWSEAMRQLGNAVPVALARVVAGSVSNELRKRGGGRV